MASIDTNVGNLAAPAIADGFGGGLGEVVFGLAAYTLTYASTLITGARLGGNHGRARVFRCGIVLFTLASGGIAVAPDIGVLIAARGVQGLGAALMIPQAISFIQADFAGTARARALTAYGLVIGLGGALGLALGGPVIDLDLLGLGWRAVFLINVPLGAGLLVLSSTSLPTVPGTPRAIDTLSVLLLTIGGLCTIGPIAVASSEGMSPLGRALLGVGLILVGLFWRRQHRHKDALLDPRLVKSRGVRSALLALLLLSAVYTGAGYGVAAALQDEHHGSAATAGAALLPFLGGYIAGSIGGAVIPAPRHRALALAGVLLQAGALLGLASITAHGWPALGAPVLLAATGIGYGAAFNPTVGLALRHVPTAFIDDASGLTTTTIQLSLALGTAVLGGLYNATGSLQVSLAAMGIASLAATIPLAAMPRTDQRQRVRSDPGVLRRH